MITRRNQALKAQLEKMNCDLAIITSPIHIQYYTGFDSDPHERFFAYMIDLEQDRSYLFLPTLDLEKAEAVALVDELVPVSDTENGYEIMKGTIGSSFQRIAIEKEFMTVAGLEDLQANFANPHMVGLDACIQGQRLCKEEAEILHVKKAIELTEKGLDHIFDYVKVGMTESEIKMELEFYLQSLGADGMAFDTLVLTGANSALPHGISGSSKVALGDFLLFDFGVTVNGYHSDLTRTFVVGSPTKEQEAIYETVRQANEAAIASLQLGQALKNVDLAARNLIESAGYGPYFTHRIGHGLGLEVHEQPSIHRENEQVLQKGMLFTIEPGIYLKNVGGVRIEDDIYLNHQGEVEVLTSYPKELRVIEG